MATLYVRGPSGYREADSRDVIASAQGLISRRYRAGSPVFDNPSRTREYLTLKLGALEYEVFGCLHLDSRHRLIAFDELFRGTIDGASVYPREVVKQVLARNAAAVILVHNHSSSGVAEPSSADEHITRRLRDALALIDVRVLDHLIVGERTYSFAEHGRL